MGNKEMVTMNTEFDFSNNQIYMIEITSLTQFGNTTIDLVELTNESDLQEFNEIINEYQNKGTYVGCDIV